MKKLWLWQHTMVVGVQLFCIMPNFVRGVCSSHKESSQLCWVPPYLYGWQTHLKRTSFVASAKVIRNPPNYVGSLLMTSTHLAGIEPAFSSPEDDVLSIILQVQLPNYTLNGLRYQ